MGFSREDKELMWQAQGGRCAMCREPLGEDAHGPECTAVMLIGRTVNSCVESVILGQPHTGSENQIPETLSESEASATSGSAGS